MSNKFDEFIEAMCTVAIEHLELSCALLFEAQIDAP